MMGYFKNETETINTIDKKGFVHSGDEGYLDEQGRLFITGRFKELIVTAGG
jgi:long-subunit acyl-CoA synthetase (AMP-forming)